MSVKDKLTAIADVLREMHGESALYSLDEIAEKIASLPEYTKNLKYDLNGDGYINETDLNRLLAMVYTSSYDAKYDLDGDGIISDFDVQMMKHVLESFGYSTVATASASDILKGKTAISCGERLTGTHVCKDGSSVSAEIRNEVLWVESSSSSGTSAVENGVLLVMKGQDEKQ